MLSDGTIIPFLNFMKFIEAYKSLFGTGSIFKRFHRTHHKVVFYLAMEERKLFLSAMNASKQFFLNLVLYYNMCFSKILTLGFVRRNEEGHEKRLFHPSCGISVTIAESDRNERLGCFNLRWKVFGRLSCEESAF